MRIENIRSEEVNNKARVVATVSWEDCDRQSQDFYFEVDEKFGKEISCNPHSFLVACAVAAMHHGERRVFIDEPICPELKDGLSTALRWIRCWYEWYRPEHPVVRIEAKVMSDGFSSRRTERAGFFFSGGIDSLACLRANRLNYSREHPGYFKDGILVYGLEIDRPEAFEYVMASQNQLAREAGITLIPVYTNIRYLEDDWTFWENEFEGAVFASIAHALDKRLSAVSLASTHNIDYSLPLGSHPLLDSNYSNYSLRIRHECITLSRLDRTKLLVDWDSALRHLRICNVINNYQPDMLNCGKCEKCVRTMLALLALDALDRTRSFPANDVSEELITSMGELNDTTYPFYPELIAPLAEKGRYDLARAIESKIASYQMPRWRKEWKRRLLWPIAELDRRYFKGSLKKVKQAIYAKKAI
jgi:hypothetical protein